MALVTMRRGIDTRVFAVNADGTATENGKEIKDFGSLFMVLRWAGYEKTAEMEVWAS